jgi:hypothetical protein
VITLVHLASAASLWAAFQGTVGAGATTRGGARSGNTQFGADYDVDVIPGAGLSANEGHFSVSLGYAPSFNFRSLGSVDQATNVLHTGYLRLGYDEHGFSLSLTQSVAAGTMAFRGLRGAPVDPKTAPSPITSGVDLVPANQVQRVLNESTGAAMGYRWDPRLTTGLSAGYAIGGGWGAEAQATLPQIRTATGNLTNGYQITTEDIVGIDLGGSNIRTKGGTLVINGPSGPILSPQFEYWTASLILNVKHRFSPLSTGSLAGGAFGYTSSIPGQTRLYSLAITGSGFYDTQLMREGRWVLTGGGGAGVGPTVNTLTGQMQRRVQGTGRLTATRQEFSLNASADGSQSIGDKQATGLVGVGVGSGYAVTKYLDLSLDYRNAWQTTHASPVTHIWTVFLAMSVKAPPVRF